MRLSVCGKAVCDVTVTSRVVTHRASSHPQRVQGARFHGYAASLQALVPLMPCRA